MSDETIQYITTDYLIEVDGGEPAPAPIEYIVELGQVGVQGIPGEKGEPGFSPTVGYILSDDTFRINITNQDGVIQTPNLYDYFADKNGYLKIDGSNADNPIILNGINISNGGIQTPSILIGSVGYGLNLGGNSISPYGSGNETVMIKNYRTSTFQKDAYIGIEANGNIYLGTTNPYKAYYNGKEIATVDQIPTVGNGTITITQGGVTKGTFTTNQSGNTTIDLDAGGSTMTNPIVIKTTDETRSLSLGIDNTTKKPYMNYVINQGGIATVPLKLIENKTAPITLTETSDGTYIIGLAYDNTTIKVNQDGQLYAVGGGGTTYTAGTGIDITSDVISIDTDVVAQLSDIPDTSDMATKTWVGSQGYLTGITSGDVTSALGYTPLQSSDLSNYVDLTSAQTITGKKTFSGAEIETNNIITLKNNAIIRGLRSGNYSTYLSSNSTSLLLGNESNNIILRGNTTRPVYRTNSTDYNIALSGDIPSISNLADKDLSNLSSTGKAVIDGQWVVANQTISTANAIDDYTIDLSNVLPVDNYKYEVILSLYMWAVTADVYYQSVKTTFFPNSVLNSVAPDGTTADVSSTTAIMIIDTDKYFKYTISSNGSTAPAGCSLTLVAYRRIGTNS